MAQGVLAFKGINCGALPVPAARDKFGKREPCKCGEIFHEAMRRMIASVSLGEPRAIDHSVQYLGAAAAQEKDQIAAVVRMTVFLSDASMREPVLRSLLSALHSGADISMAVPSVAKLLSDSDETVRDYSALLLGWAAIKPRSSCLAFEMLKKCLGDRENEHLRSYAAHALYHATTAKADISTAVPALAKCLADKCVEVQIEAALALWGAAEHGANISISIPALTECLEHPDARVRWRASAALMFAARGGAILGPKTIFALGLELADENAYVLKYAAGALGHAANNGEGISGAVQLLGGCLNFKPKDGGENAEDARQYSAATLACAAHKGADITAALRDLSGGLGDESKKVRECVALALGCAAAEKATAAKAFKILKSALRSEDALRRQYAADGLLYASDQGADISAALPQLNNLHMVGATTQSERDSVARVLEAQRLTA
jgi:hypothetical protein